MSNLLKAILQSSLLGGSLIFIACLIKGEPSLLELLLSIVSICVLLIPYRYYNILNNSKKNNINI